MIKESRLVNPLQLISLSVLILAGSFVAFQSSAKAEMMKGEVVSVKDDGSSFSLKRANDQNSPVGKVLVIRVTPQTKYDKISSLKELAAGDEVAVDAVKKRKSGTWEASAVRIFKVRLYKEAGAAKSGQG